MQASQDGDVEMVKILCEASTKEDINHQSKVHINNYTNRTPFKILHCAELVVCPHHCLSKEP